MYGKPISTTIDLYGLVIYITYFVTEEHAIEWRPDEDMYEGDAYDLLDLTLRVGFHSYIKNILQEEFESRQYHEQEQAAALAEQQELPF